MQIKYSNVTTIILISAYTERFKFKLKQSNIANFKIVNVILFILFENVFIYLL